MFEAAAGTKRGEEALAAELAGVRQKLDGLVGDLRSVDAELEGLSAEREQHALLGQVCGGLESLRDLGVADLFWAELPGHDREAHLRAVRCRVDVFEKQLGEIEERRQAVLEQIERVEMETEFLEDDLLEARRAAEEKKLEWVIEREVGSFPFRDAIMPWNRGSEDDQRFRRALAAALLASVLLGVVTPLIPLPLPEPWEPIEIPERFTRLIEERVQPPPPPPKPQEQLAKEETPEATEEPVVEKKPTQTKPTKGILAFREKFSTLAETRPAARLGSQARVRDAGRSASGRPMRALVATQAPGQSGGIDIGSLSRDAGSGGDSRIERVEVARATSSIGSGGEDRPLASGPGPSRTDEEIQIVFDRHKSALYRLYNRALRKNPTLKGQIVLRFTIQPDGSVSLCQLHSSDMKAPQLSAQVVERVKSFDFGAKPDVGAITILYPIDFLPAA